MGAALSGAWLWLLLAFVLGLVIGYFVKKRTVRELTATDASSTTRIADLEAQLDERRASKVAPAEASVSVSVSAPAEAQAKSAAPAVVALATAVASVAKKAPAAKAPAAKKSSSTRKSGPLDLAAAKVTLGSTVKLDDLKVIEGIGPKIESLFKADGIVTWRDLSKANVERLQGILDAAGPRYTIHNPVSWPKQAALLADGKWADYKTLADNLKGRK